MEFLEVVEEAVVQRCFADLIFFNRTPLVVASEHEIQAPTLTSGREQEDEFSNSPDNESTNEEEENSTKETNNKSPEDELDIELFVDLVRQFPVIWNTRLNRLKITTRRLHGTISALLYRQ